MPYSEEQARKRVIAIVAHHTGVASAELRGSTGLFGTLGVTGDDASILLEDIGKRIVIDFSEIQFDRHFGPEGGTFRDLLWMVLPLPIVALLAYVLAPFTGEPRLWWFIPLYMLLVWGWMYLGTLVRPSIKKWNRERVPVTINDLVQAAILGRWNMNYEGEVRSERMSDA